MSLLDLAVVELAGVVDDLAAGAEDLDGAAVGSLGAAVCLFGVEEGLSFFLGGSLGIFFFCSGIVYHCSV